jgi:hypothetical protein
MLHCGSLAIIWVYIWLDMAGAERDIRLRQQDPLIYP